MGEIRVREFTPADLATCVELAREVHRCDGYPPYLPNNDFHRLLTNPAAIDAFVATIEGGGVIGHVALHPGRAGAAVTKACNVLGCEASGLGVIARLFVAPPHRRRGVAQLLLDAVTNRARHDRQLRPILDVWVEFASAVALYERCGWRNIGTVDTLLPDGRVLPEHVFLAPERSSAQLPIGPLP